MTEKNYTHPLRPSFPPYTQKVLIALYRERLPARPSLKRALDEAREFCSLFPLRGAGLIER